MSLISLGLGDVHVVRWPELTTLNRSELHGVRISGRKLLPSQYTPTRTPYGRSVKESGDGMLTPSVMHYLCSFYVRIHTWYRNSSLSNHLLPLVQIPTYSTRCSKRDLTTLSTSKWLMVFLLTEKTIATNVLYQTEPSYLRVCRMFKWMPGNSQCGEKAMKSADYIYCSCVTPISWVLL